ncbi:MAG: Lpg1974 family pore-forming outer membrane protein [Chlamydiota bacterium]
MSFLLTSSKKSILFAILLLITYPKLYAASNDLNGLPNISYQTENGWAISADFLFWFPSEELSTIWASVISVGSNTSSWAVPGFNFKWDYGFRIGAGYDFKYDQWDTALYWTWFRTETSHTISSAPDAIINPEFDAAFLTKNNAQSLKGDWSLLFNMIDWELGRNYWVSKGLSLRPFLGIKGGWIHQSIHANYYNLTIGNTLTSHVGKEHLKNNFWGIGPSGGINTKWKVRNFKSHFLHLFGDFSFATMWGSWTCADVYKSTVPQTFSIKTKNSTLGALMFRGFLGIGWDVDLNTSKSHFAAKLGFETQLWLDQLRIATLQVQRLHGDLTLQGLTFNCRYDY